MFVTLMYSDPCGENAWQFDMEDADFDHICDKYATCGYSINDDTVEGVIKDVFNIGPGGKTMNFTKEELSLIYDAVALATQIYTTDMSDMDNAFAWERMGQALQDKIFPHIMDDVDM